MPQPWDEPAESMDPAADSLPLAGLLAELLARAEAEGIGQAAPAAIGGAEASPAGIPEPWPLAPAPAQLEAADWMRALGEAELERQQGAAASFPADLLARLAADPAPEVCGGLPEVPSAEPSSCDSAPKLDPHGAAGDEQRELELENGACGGAEAEQETAAAIAAHTAPAASPPDARPEDAEGLLAWDEGGGQAAPREILLAAPPGPDPVSPAAPAERLPALAPPQAGDPLPSEPAVGAAFPAEGEAAPQPATEEAGKGTASEAGPGAVVAPGQPLPGAVLSASAGPHQSPPAPVLPDEEDEFELVDAEMAGRMLDQLIDAARSAIQSSLAGAPWQAAGREAGEGESGREDERPEAAPAASALPAGSAEALPASRPVSSRPSFPAEVLGQEPPPLPPAAALMGMGLPERLRARLERIGDLDRVLAAQSVSAAGTAADQRGRLLVFRVGAEYYGLPIENVREVERVTRVTPVPGAPRLVRGLVNLRGEILPLVDLRLLLGAGADDDGMPASPRLIVAHADRREPPLALMVEELNGLAPLDEEEAGPTVAVSAEGRTGVLGAVQHRGRRIWRLDPAAVLGLATLEEKAQWR